MTKANYQRTTILIHIVLLLLLVEMDAFAIVGIDKPIKGSSSGCFIFNQYTISVQRSGQAGDIITVRKRSKGNEVNCDAKSKELIMTIDGTDSTETFAGVYNHLIFTDSGTGPDGRGVAIYDLRKRKRVYSATYATDELRIENNALIFYKELDLKNKRQCPDADKLKSEGWDYGFEQKIRIDLKSLREETIGEITCSPRQ